MHDPVDATLARHGRVATRTQLLRVMSRGQLDHLVRTGRLSTPFPQAYCRPWDADLPTTRRRAALVSTGPPAALSHLTALEMWGVLDARPAAPLHVTTPATRAPRGNADLVVHRARRFPDVARIDGLIAVTAADAIVTSWPLLPPTQRRGPALRAMRDRITLPAQLRESVDRYRRLPEREALRDLIALLEAGCESELEIWGHTHVFDIPGLRHGVKQYHVPAGGRRYRLDLAFTLERVAVELDGFAYHSTHEQRERDTRRDAALAAVGWLTVRFTHHQLTTDPDGCQRQLLAILAQRRRLCTPGR